MKLFELFQITELSGSELRQIRNLETIPSPGDLQQLLIDQGMELIASGSYSQVYGHSGSSWVVKVIGQPLNMSNENERCGVQWLRYCNKNWNTNTHIMRVPFVRTIRLSNVRSDSPERIYVGVLERLEPISENEMRAMPRIMLKNGEIEKLAEIAYAGIFSGYISGVWDGFAEQVYKRYPNAVRPLIDGLLQDYIKHQDIDTQDPDELYINPIPEWPYDPNEVTEILGTVGGFDIMKSLARIFIRESGMDTPLIQAIRGLNKFSCTKDLHFQNIMIRPSTGELVITDPFVDF